MPKNLKLEKINAIIDLKKIGHTHDEICKIIKCSKRTVNKICKNYLYSDYPTIKIPENIKETKYPGYYISSDGKAYRLPTRFNENNKVNEYGLIPLNTHLRGNPKDKKYQYHSINVTIRDDSGKYLKQMKVNIHKLVAETFIPNPYNYPEIDHIDRNKQNNSIDNLRWTNRIENMSFKGKPFKITDTKTGMIYEGINLVQWMKDNWEWISKRTKTPNPEKLSKTLRTDNRCCGFILER